MNLNLLSTKEIVDSREINRPETPVDPHCSQSENGISIITKSHGRIKVET